MQGDGSTLTMLVMFIATKYKPITCEKHHHTPLWLHGQILQKSISIFSKAIKKLCECAV